MTILEVAERMARLLGRKRIRPQLLGTYRVGDIRHCFADISRARQVLGYEPRVTIEEGMVELAERLKGEIALDLIAEANTALRVRGLTL